MRSVVVRFLLPLLLFLSACSTAVTVDAESDGLADSEPIRLSMSLYVVDEAGEGQDAALSSQRTVSDVEQIAERMQDIWDQADIELEINTITRIEASPAVLSELTLGETGAFLNAVLGGVTEVPGAGAINGFYVRSLGTINGIAPFGARVFFVTDEPSVHDERVSSHEIGHILGLHHAVDHSDRLMFSGTNGTDLIDEEIGTSRYAAQGILDGVR